MEPISATALVVVHAAPYLVKGARAAYGWLRSRATGMPAGDYGLSSTPEIVGPPPAGWARYAGARPELRGAPRNSILAVPGLVRHPPAVRAALLDLAVQLQISVDAFAVLIEAESGWKEDIFNPAGPAFGLIQLTPGAKLLRGDELDAVRGMSAVEQLHAVVHPYYARFGVKVTGATPGDLYVANFLGAFLGASDDAVMARKGDPKTGEIYAVNAAFDAAGKGTITVGDVHERAAQVARRANGQRIAVDGQILPAQAGGTSAPAAAARPSPSPAGPRTPSPPATKPRAPARAPRAQATSTA